MSETGLSIQEELCRAMLVISQRSLELAQFDKTIVANIVECTDKVKGKYKVKYQDAYYNVSADTNVTYSKNAEVYILVPMGDFSKPKKIIGLVKDLGADYVNLIPTAAYFEPIGSNILKAENQVIELSSYTEDAKYIYSKNSANGVNNTLIDSRSINEYFSEANYIYLKADIKTALPENHKMMLGDYGLIIKLIFTKTELDEDGLESTTEVEQFLQFNIEDIAGQPYHLLDYTAQSAQWQLNELQFKEVDSIMAYTSGFEKQIESDINTIFIKDLEIYAAKKIDELELNGCVLKLLTPQGTIFYDDTSKITLKPEVLIQGKVASNLKDLKFYWFAEQSSIELGSPFYNAYGGQGWKCLNTFTGTDSEKTWNPGESYLEIPREDMLFRQRKYKCVCQYDASTIISKEITLKNFSKNLSNIVITSSLGTTFYKGVGSTELTCSVLNNTSNNLQYKWASRDSVGTYKYLGTDNPQKVEAKDIVNFITYTCDVYDGDTLIGFQNITLTNSYEEQRGLQLVINNGEAVYKYDANGLKPGHTSTSNQLSITPLTFTLYDENGEIIDNDTVVTKYPFKWFIPSQGTMIQPVNSMLPSRSEENGYYYYSQVKEFNYTIPSSYNNAKINNRVGLKLEYQGQNLTAYTDLLFLKDGDSGTNGTDYVCKIVPNIVDGTVAPTYPKLTFIGKKGAGVEGTAAATLNFTTFGTDGAPTSNARSATQWFKLKMWYLGQDISDDIDPKSIQWSIVKNSYNLQGTTEPSYIDIIPQYDKNEDGKDVIVGYNFQVTDSAEDLNTLSKADTASNLIRASFTYDMKPYNVTLPLLIEHTTDNNYHIDLKAGSGFREVLYSSDGSSFIRSSNPFEIEIYKNGKLIDEEEYKIVTKITLTIDEEGVVTETRGEPSKKLDIFTFSETGFGSIYENEAWSDPTATPFLKVARVIEVVDDNEEGIEKTETVYGNKFEVTPVTNYTGRCINIGFNVTAIIDGKTLNLTIPIYYFLNPYGLANLNGWTGNSLEIDEDGQYILTPQIGAGKKEGNNTFTGMLMGVVRSKSGQEDIGLMGYTHGLRSIFLDADSGKAEFGTAATGKLIIDPKDNNKLKIYSSKYSENSGEGLEINFGASPHIKYGSKKFEVNSEGILKATEANIAGVITSQEGYIGGWKIGKTTITGGNVTLSSENLSDSFIAGFTLGENEQTLRIKVGSNFGINNGGTLYAKGVNIKGKIYAEEGTLGGWTLTSTKIENADTTRPVARIRIPPPANATGDNTWTYVLAFGGTDHSDLSSCPFRVTKNGKLYATDAVITGNITVEEGKIGGWTIGSNAIYTTSNSFTSETIGDYFNNANTKYFGSKGLSIKDNFRVNSSGILTAKGVNITGAITATSADIGGIVLKSDGTLTIPATSLSGKAPVAVIPNLDASKITTGQLAANRIDADNLTVRGVNVLGELVGNSIRNSNSTFIVSSKEQKITLGNSYFTKNLVYLDVNDTTAKGAVEIGKPSVGSWEDISILPTAPSGGWPDGRSAGGNIGGANRRWHTSWFYNINGSSYSGSSNRELKENIQIYDSEQAYQELKQMPFYTFFYKNFAKSGSIINLGTMIDYMPAEATIPTEERINAYNTGSMMFWGIAATQATQKRVESLLERVSQLENEIKELKGEN